VTELSATGWIASLDGLRGIAAVGVMIFHFNYFFLPQAALAGALPFMRPILDHLYLGVDLFFLMSGFVMAHVYGQKLASNWRAYWRGFAVMRFARIYPLFALTTLVCRDAGRRLPVGPDFQLLRGARTAFDPPNAAAPERSMDGIAASGSGEPGVPLAL
jgi:peptidoglycan/LPS O-acetylase OafA/YrhL